LQRRKNTKKSKITGTLTWDFRPMVFFIKQLPLGPFSNIHSFAFTKIFDKVGCTVVSMTSLCKSQGCQWHRCVMCISQLCRGHHCACHSGVIETAVEPTFSNIFMHDQKKCFFMRKSDSAAHGTAVRCANMTRLWPHIRDEWTASQYNTCFLKIMRLCFEICDTVITEICDKKGTLTCLKFFSIILKKLFL
jgi:hypothetical protein